MLVVGFEGAELIFMDPATIGNYTTMFAEEFLTRWHDQYQLSGADQVRLVHYGLTFEGVAPDYDPSEFKELNLVSGILFRSKQIERAPLSGVLALLIPCPAFDGKQRQGRDGL